MEEEKNTEVQEEETQEGQETDQTPGKSLPIKLIIVCILGLSVLAGGFFVWKAGLISGLSKDSDAPSADIGETDNDIGPIFSLDTFIVNLLGDRGKSYLKVKVDLELDGEKLSEEITRRLPQFRDSILTLLSNKSHDDVKTLEGKYQLRSEIISMLNQYLDTGKITNVYFTDFIVQ